MGECKTSIFIVAQLFKTYLNVSFKKIKKTRNGPLLCDIVLGVFCFLWLGIYRMIVDLSQHVHDLHFYYNY